MNRSGIQNGRLSMNKLIRFLKQLLNILKRSKKTDMDFYDRGGWG